MKIRLKAFRYLESEQLKDLEKRVALLKRQRQLLKEKACEHNYVYVTDKVGYGYKECSKCGRLK